MRRLTAFLAASTLTLATSILAQPTRLMLTPEAEASLPDEAKALYADARLMVDHINYDEAMRLVAQAAEKAPDHIEIQFLTAAAGRRFADLYFAQTAFTMPSTGMESYTSPPWQTAEPYLEISAAALERLQVNPELTTDNRARLEDELGKLNALRDGIAERDRRRMETALPLVMTIRSIRAERMDIGAGQEFDERDPRNVLEEGKAPEEKEGIGAESSAAADATDELNPFKLLPGEYVENFLPPPPQPRQANIRQQNVEFQENSRNPFGPDASGAAEFVSEDVDQK